LRSSRHFRIRTPSALFGSTPVFISVFRRTKKVMGLAAYGDPEVYRRQLASILQVSDDNYKVDLAALGFPSFEPAGFEPLLGPKRKAGDEILPRHMHFAAALQDATNAAVKGLLRRLGHSVGEKRLCVAGGVALNCVTNALIRRDSAFADIFIPSAPHDAGTALGAALAVHCAEQGRRPPPGGATPILGRSSMSERFWLRSRRPG
jgi:carbamoyltransferase